jgi:hypothetical protein
VPRGRAAGLDARAKDPGRGILVDGLFVQQGFGQTIQFLAMPGQQPRAVWLVRVNRLLPSRRTLAGARLRA